MNIEDLKLYTVVAFFYCYMELFPDQCVYIYAEKFKIETLLFYLTTTSILQKIRISQHGYKLRLHCTFKSKGDFRDLGKDILSPMVRSR